MARRVFVSGPIQGVETEQSYRDIIRRTCERHGYEVIDPWLREKILYKRSESQWWSKVPARNFIDRDLKDIERCDIFVAYLPVLSAGTCMELFYAKLKQKKTLCVCLIENPSPWITVHSDRLLGSMDELNDALQQEAI